MNKALKGRGNPCAALSGLCLFACNTQGCARASLALGWLVQGLWPSTRQCHQKCMTGSSSREDEVDGGCVANALGHGIATQGETVGELRGMVRDAVRCHFGDGVPGPMLFTCVSTPTALHHPAQGWCDAGAPTLGLS